MLLTFFLKNLETIVSMIGFNWTASLTLKLLGKLNLSF